MTSCSSSPPTIKVKPENLSWVALNILLDKVERYADKPSRGFPTVNKELISIGKVKISTSFRVRMDRREEERFLDGDLRNPLYKGEDHAFNARTKFRVGEDIIYFEVRFRW